MNTLEDFIDFLFDNDLHRMLGQWNYTSIVNTPILVVNGVGKVLYSGLVRYIPKELLASSIFGIQLPVGKDTILTIGIWGYETYDEDEPFPEDTDNDML